MNDRSLSVNGGKKSKTAYYTCERCSANIRKDLAKCSSCGFWNTPKVQDDTKDQTVLLSDVSPNPIQYIKTDGPWDPCFSQEGGIATDSVTLIGGVPGAGKSTMSLQMSDRIAEITQKEVLYIGTEESPNQIKARALRLNLTNMSKIRIHPMGSSADLSQILLNRKPCAIMLDSLPGLTADSDVAVELCKRFKDYAVELNAPVIIIDHVNKDRDFAGLMALQHAVDTLILLSGSQDEPRELQTIKNRYGPTNRSVVMDMTEKGLFRGKYDLDIEDDEDDDFAENEQET